MDELVTGRALPLAPSKALRPQVVPTALSAEKDFLFEQVHGQWQVCVCLEIFQMSRDHLMAKM